MKNFKIKLCSNPKMLLHIYFFLVIVLFNEVKASFNPDPTYKNAGM